MINILIYFFIGLSLSIDAFSTALAIGTTNPSNKIIYLEPLIIGIFHFIMPIIGSFIGTIFINKLISKANIIVSIVFIILAIELYRSRNEEENIFIKNIFSMIVIAFVVSIDSLIVGLVLSLDSINIYLVALIFSFISSIATFIGIKFGLKLKKRYLGFANYLGILILLILAIKNLVI